MPILDRIRNAWGALTKAAPSMAGYGYQYGYGPTWSDQFRFRRAPTPQDLVENYKALIYTCVNLNANAVARGTLRMYAITGAGQRKPKCHTRPLSRRQKAWLKGEPILRGHSPDGSPASQWRPSLIPKAFAHADDVDEVTDHPLLDALVHGNPELNLGQQLHYATMSLDIVGSGYWVPDEFQMGMPTEFWSIIPQWVYPIFDGNSMVPQWYQFGPNRYPKDQIVRFRRLSMKNPYGMGYAPAHAAIEYARLEGTYVNIQEEMLANGPRPDLIISLKDDKGSFGQAERDRLEKRLNQGARGGRAGSAVAVDAPISITPMSYSPTDLAGLELSKYDMERIANCFDIPISMLTNESSNRSVADSGLEQHARNAIEPRHKIISDEITRYIHSLDPNDNKGLRRLFVAFDPMVAEDEQAKADLHTKYLGAGVITINEVRTEIGYDAVPDGDEILVPNNLVLLGDAVTPLADQAQAQADIDAQSEELEPDDEDLEDVDNDAEQAEADEEEDETKSFGRKPCGCHEAEDDDAEIRERAKALLDRLEAELEREDGDDPFFRKAWTTKSGCGTGAGGFQPGNTCGGKGGKGSPQRGRRVKRGKHHLSRKRQKKRGGKHATTHKRHSAARRTLGQKIRSERQATRQRQASERSAAKPRDRGKLARTHAKERVAQRAQHHAESNGLRKDQRSEMAAHLRGGKAKSPAKTSGEAFKPDTSPLPAPVNPSHPMGQKIAADAHSHEITSKVAALHSEVESARAAHAANVANHEAAIAAFNKSRGAKREAAREAVETHSLAAAESRYRVEQAEKSSREAAHKLLAINPKGKLAVDHQSAESLPAHMQASLHEATGFIGQMVKGKVKPVKSRALEDFEEQRAFHMRDTVHMSADDDVATYAHELGHHLEAQVSKIRGAAHSFLAYRVGGEASIAMNSVHAGAYQAHEVGRKDRFDAAFGDEAHYVGKDYHGAATEIMSMGIEKLHRDPIHFAKQDPEYFAFVVGTLHGRIDGNF